MITSETKELSDAEMRAQFLNETEIEKPDTATQITILRAEFQKWSNTYFATCANLRVAHDAGMTDMERMYFEDAKRLRKAVLVLKSEIEKLTGK